MPQWARELLDTERVARLAYVDDEDRPRVLPVTFTVAAGAVWSAIDEKPKRTAEPARVAHLKRSPRAALLADVYADDWDELAWVQLLGTVDVLPTSGAPEALEALARKYRQYAERPPPGPLLRLTVERALQWRASEPRGSTGSPRPDHSLQEPG